MIDLIIAVMIFFASPETAWELAPYPEPALAYEWRGNLSQYSPGVMERVARINVERGHISQEDSDNYIHKIAVYHCQFVGHTGILTIDGHDPVPVLITDCANPEHKKSRVLWYNGIIAEVGYETARHFGFEGRGGVFATLEINED